MSSSIVLEVYSVIKQVAGELLPLLIILWSFIQWLGRHSGNDIRFRALTAWIEERQGVRTCVVGLHTRTSRSIPDTWKNLFDRLEVWVRLWLMRRSQHFLLSSRQLNTESSILRVNFDFITDKLVSVLKELHGANSTKLQEKGGHRSVRTVLRYIAVMIPPSKTERTKLACFDASIQAWGLMASYARAGRPVVLSNKSGYLHDPEAGTRLLSELILASAQVVIKAKSATGGDHVTQPVGPAIVRQTSLDVENDEGLNAGHARATPLNLSRNGALTDSAELCASYVCLPGVEVQNWVSEGNAITV